MWTLNYNQSINISHFLCLDYDSRDTKTHGHILNVNINLFATRLNPHNMIIDTNLIKEVVDRLDHNNTNEYMRVNNIKGNATLENIILIFKTQLTLLLSSVNEDYNTDVRILDIRLKDETGREVIYNMR